jgi:hypothetical protein
VIDADPRSPTYATVVTTVPVAAVGTRPHHTEHELSPSGTLWANGFDSGQTFRFDVNEPTRPRLVGTFREAGPYGHPHSYVRMPNGHVLATFQRRTGASHATGGLVELDSEGRVVRHAAAAVASDTGIRPYSLAIVPALDRIVTTATDMHLGTRSRAVQIWRLSDLTLLHTIQLPPGSRGDENAMTAEPRVLADGRTVVVNTFTCGLYRLRGIDTDAPTAEWLFSTPWKEPPFCSVPVVAGRFWLQPNGPERAVVTLDLSDPARPRETSRLTLGPNEVPHWMSLDATGTRVVITGYQALESRVLVARLDPATGALTIDSTFITRGATVPGVDFAREQWPHGATGRAIPHGAVFSRQR